MIFYKVGEIYERVFGQKISIYKLKHAIRLKGWKIKYRARRVYFFSYELGGERKKNLQVYNKARRVGAPVGADPRAAFKISSKFERRIVTINQDVFSLRNFYNILTGDAVLEKLS